MLSSGQQYLALSKFLVYMITHWDTYFTASELRILSLWLQWWMILKLDLTLAKFSTHALLERTVFPSKHNIYISIQTCLSFVLKPMVQISHVVSPMFWKKVAPKEKLTWLSDRHPILSGSIPAASRPTTKCLRKCKKNTNLHVS